MELLVTDKGDTVVAGTRLWNRLQTIKTVKASKGFCF